MGATAPSESASASTAPGCSSTTTQRRSTGGGGGERRLDSANRGSQYATGSTSPRASSAEPADASGKAGAAISGSASDAGIAPGELAPSPAAPPEASELDDQARHANAKSHGKGTAAARRAEPNRSARARTASANDARTWPARSTASPATTHAPERTPKWPAAPLPVARPDRARGSPGRTAADRSVGGASARVAARGCWRAALTRGDPFLCTQYRNKGSGQGSSSNPLPPL